MDILPLSGSVGGAPILLNVTQSPGNLLHQNPSDSGANHSVQDILVGNPNSNPIIAELSVQNPAVAGQLSDPKTVGYPIRVSLPPFAEGGPARIGRVPIVLAPGFDLYLKANLQPGNEAPYVLGHVAAYPVAFEGGGRGGMNQIGSLVLGDGVLDAGWDTYPWTTDSIANPVNVVHDTANNRFQVEREGAWVMSVVANIGFVSSNSGRTTYIRLYNETQTLAYASTPLYAGRDQTGALGVFNFILDLAANVIGDWLRVEVGGGDSFTGVTAEGGSLVLLRAGDS